ncbi:MAG TPA: SagB/ThcOx family dehydrogenase [Archangium sp.]|nr:SagB/ThcOx family dehydrogenase [Archangium sp.]
MAFGPIEQQFVKTGESAVWELFHENSKMSRRERHTAFALPPSDETVVRAMNQLRTVKPYQDFPKVALPQELPASEKSLDEVLVGRESARRFQQGDLHLVELAKALFMGYGITRDNSDTHFPRPFRTIPSGGALYPLEIYVHATRVQGLEPGLYHYDPEDSSLDVLRVGDDSGILASSAFQPELVQDAAAILLVSAVFMRSTFKYGDRGYRFVLLEAGHLAQNVILTTREMGLAAVPLGGYVDREWDGYLGVDGLSESVVYALLLGR